MILLRLRVSIIITTNIRTRRWNLRPEGFGLVFVLVCRAGVTRGLRAKGLKSNVVRDRARVRGRVRVGS